MYHAEFHPNDLCTNLYGVLTHSIAHHFELLYIVVSSRK